MSKFGKLLGDVTGIQIGPSDDELQQPVEVETAPVERPASAVSNRPAVRSQQPTLRAHGPAPLPTSITQKVNVNSDVVEAKSEERFKKELDDVLAASTPKYLTFLATKEELTGLLSDSLSADALEAAAVKGALKKVKFTEADVHAAVNAMRDKLRELKNKFDADLQQARVDKIDAPNKQIEETLKQVDGIEAQIADLQKKIVDLKAGIQPTREGIAAAEQKLAQAQAIDEAADAKVEDYLAQLEQDLLARLPK